MNFLCLFSCFFSGFHCFFCILNFLKFFTIFSCLLKFFLFFFVLTHIFCISISSKRLGWRFTLRVLIYTLNRCQIVIEKFLPIISPVCSIWHQVFLQGISLFSLLLLMLLLHPLLFHFFIFLHCFFLELFHLFLSVLSFLLSEISEGFFLH